MILFVCKQLHQSLFLYLFIIKARYSFLLQISAMTIFIPLLGRERLQFIEPLQHLKNCRMHSIDIQKVSKENQRLNCFKCWGSGDVRNSSVLQHPPTVFHSPPALVKFASRIIKILSSSTMLLWYLVGQTPRIHCCRVPSRATFLFGRKLLVSPLKGSLCTQAVAFFQMFRCRNSNMS